VANTEKEPGDSASREAGTDPRGRRRALRRSWFSRLAMAFKAWRLVEMVVGLVHNDNSPLAGAVAQLLDALTSWLG
jgi:hypothetical protein